MNHGEHGGHGGDTGFLGGINGIGWIDMQSVDNQIDLVMKFVAPSDAKRPVVAQTWTNDFVGKIKLTQPEVASARAAASDYSKMLSFMT